MSNIRRIAPRKCPECNATGTLFVAQDRRVTCRLCGYKEPDESGQSTRQTGRSPLKSLKKAADDPLVDAFLDEMMAEEDKAPEPPPRERYKITYSLMSPSAVDAWTKAIYTSGLDALHRDDVETALDCFKRAADAQHDFTDAHLWLARLSDDPDKKREHYSVVIAHHPNNQEVVRELMVLNGQLSEDEANRLKSTPTKDNVKTETLPVGTVVKDLACEVCGGRLTVDGDGTTAVCAHCGNRQSLVKKGDQYGIKNLSMSILKQRAKGVRWEIGERIIHCNNCGAERIHTEREMNSLCPFCSSNQVILTDALESFIQPDSVIPFRVTERQAAAALDEALNSRTERFKSFFVNNRVVRREMRSVYLPYWYFDASVSVTRTVTAKRGESGSSLGGSFDASGNYQLLGGSSQENFSDALHDVPWAGFRSPPPKLIARLGKYDVDTAVKYRPVLLADHSAEIYSVNFDQASLEVRKYIKQLVKDRFTMNDPFSGETVRVSSTVQSMSFRLLLVPLWVVTLTEDDRDTRIGVIHGQTGKAHLGKAFKS